MYGGTLEENKELALEDIALQVDRIDSLLAAISLPVDNSIHITALKELLPEMKGILKKAYFELGGEDVWAVNTAITGALLQLSL